MESKKEIYEKVMHYAHLLEDSLGYNDTEEGERWGKLVNQLQDFEFDQPVPKEIKTPVQFYIATYPADESDEQPHKEVLAVFLNSRGENGTKAYFTCYAFNGQHSTCTSEFIELLCKKASPKQYAELKKELENLGYKLDVKS